MTRTYNICLLPGDGIGPEIIAEAVSYTHLDVYKRQLLPVLKPGRRSLGLAILLWPCR